MLRALPLALWGQSLRGGTFGATAPSPACWRGWQARRLPLPPEAGAYLSRLRPAAPTPSQPSPARGRGLHRCLQIADGIALASLPSAGEGPLSLAPWRHDEPFQPPPTRERASPLLADCRWHRAGISPQWERGPPSLFPGRDNEPSSSPAPPARGRGPHRCSQIADGIALASPPARERVPSRRPPREMMSPSSLPHGRRLAQPGAPAPPAASKCPERRWNRIAAPPVAPSNGSSARHAQEPCKGGRQCPSGFRSQP